MPFTGNDTATTNFSKAVQESIQNTLYDELRSGLPHLPPGVVLPATFQADKRNPVLRFNRVADLDATPANHIISTEGVPPSGQELALGYEEFSVTQYGDFVRLSDIATFQRKDLARTAGERVARQMAEVIDNLAKASFEGGDNRIFSGSSNTQTSDVASGDVLLSSDIKRAVALLGGANVERINGMYVGIIHPYVAFDLKLDDDAGGWIDVSKYGATTQLFNGEIGSYAGVRFVETAAASVFADQGTGSIDVFQTLILGKNALAVGDISTKEIIVERGGVSDPLHQFETVGWKCYLGTEIVGEMTSAANGPEPRYIAIESASSI